MDKTTSQLKTIFMKCLYESPIIVDFIDDKKIQYPDDLLGTHIFPQLKVDFTEQEQGTYIGLNISYPSISRNELYKNYTLTFLIVSNNGHLYLNGKNRTDLISEEIIHLFNWKTDVGCQLELKSDKEFVLDIKHYARELNFVSISNNSLDNKFRGSR
ncbi:MAG: hypothetical protein RR806_03150 [Oscillospiraceae bacterium]